MKRGRTSEAATLRQKAEEKLKLRTDVACNVLEPDLRKLTHELQVHQIELEMQYEQLKQAKEESDSVTQKYTELYDFAPSGYFTLTRLGEIIALNFQGARLLGKERQHLINRRFGSSVSDQTKPVFNSFLDKLFTGKGNESCEVTLSVKANSIPVYVYLTGHTFGNDEQCQIIAVDITERKQAEQELIKAKDRAVENEVKLKEAQRIAHLGNWALNIETNELVWSDEIYRIFNCEPNEFGATYEAFLGFIHPDDREKVNAAYLKSLETKTEYQIEHRIITKDNQLKYVKEKCTTTFNEQGKPLNSFGIVMDISEQKALENELIRAKEQAEESEEKFRVLIESNSVAIYLTDLNGKCTYVNPKWSELAHLAYNEALGDGWVNGIYEEDRDKVFGNWDKMIASDGNWGFEYRFGTPDKISWVFGSAKSYKNNLGQIEGFIGSNVDITKRKQAENKILNQLDELQRWNNIALGREDRHRELKREVNELLVRLGESIRYSSQEINNIIEKPPIDE